MTEKPIEITTEHAAAEVWAVNLPWKLAVSQS